MVRWGSTTGKVGPHRAFFLPVLRARGPTIGRNGQPPMRYLWTYLLAVVVFAFGFLCAAAFTAGED